MMVEKISICYAAVVGMAYNHLLKHMLMSGAGTRGDIIVVDIFFKYTCRKAICTN